MEQHRVAENALQGKSGISVRVGRTPNNLLSWALTSDVEKTNEVTSSVHSKDRILVFHVLGDYLKHPDSSEVGEERKCCAYRQH